MKINTKILKSIGIGVLSAIILFALAWAGLTFSRISEQEAREIALSHSGVSENEIEHISVWLDTDDFIAEYKIDFYTQDAEYAYEINSVTGNITDYDYDKQAITPVITEKSLDTQNAEDTGVYITEEEVTSIVLQHANIKESLVEHIVTKLEKDNGVMEYEVSFYTADTEYDYDINAATGEVVSYDYEIRANQSQTTQGEYITQEQAKTIALSDANMSENEVSYIKVEFDIDDGIPEYEVEWWIDKTEYQYTINAIDSTILSREVDNN